MAGKRNRATYEADLQAIQSPYVFYGTPLPALDSNTRDDGSFVPIWKQEVTDERGRKRLHGAFTGGFSAGYFNTVGSKEGWTPATFVSSRSNRWKDGGKQSQKVEDIMDEEDKAEAEEARQVSTKSGFASLGSTEDEVNKRAPLMDLFRTTGDTMGFKLLRKMGWKEGQGIGPRVWREAVLDDGLAQGRSGFEKHLFAPKNSKMILIKRKTDRQGLGYRTEDCLQGVRSPSPAPSDNEDGPKARPKLQPGKKSAFGVGVLNDTGSDDEDPYSLGPRISYSKTLGGDKKKKKKKVDGKGGSGSNPLLTKRPVFVSTKATKGLTGFRKCHDGRLPLDGFILSVSKAVIETNKFPPPKVPEDWKPAKAASDGNAGIQDWQSSSDLAKASNLEPSSRGSILGEAPLPSKSVFDFMKPDARARLVTLTKNESLPPAGSESAPIGTTSSDLISEAPLLDPAIASSALGRGVGGFVPYTDNPPKLARYRAYLSYSAGISTETPVRPSELPKDEWLRELQEFAHAATIFKPMTGNIATRFTSASNVSLQTHSSTKDDNTGTVLSSSTNKTKDPAEEPAVLSMFGHLTRSSTFFYPSRLLCKRFNVPVPAHVHSGNEGTSSAANQGTSSSKSIPSMDNATHAGAAGTGFSSRFQSSGYQTADNKEPVRVEGVGADGSVQSSKDIETDTQIGSGLNQQGAGVSAGVDPDRNEALEQERPGDDVFRAIFGSDSEDE